MITPGDIPESMVKKAAIMEQTSWDGGRWDNLIAMVLNEAIEAGLVSPPCHCIRSDGRLFMTSGMVRLWPGKPEMSHHEHWKGQTE